MSLTSRRPGALLRFGLYLPTWLYRLHLGWLLGRRFLMLLHTGRRTGRIHRTVVEVVSHEGSLSFYVVSGWGRKADWYRNIHEQPEVQIRVGSRTMNARAEDVPTEKAAGIMEEYTNRYPLAFKELTQFFLGEEMQPGLETARRVVEMMPMVAFRVRS
jgi:deazaflavin-dependent oxidoreductase (nitroreductase family)